MNPSNKSSPSRQSLGRLPSRPPSNLHSDCPPETEEFEGPTLGQRSVSLTTLQPTVIQPRMAQLETLEAKMASIEVSLSSTPRRKKNGLGSVSLGSSIRSMPKDMAVKELESLRNALRDKENIIQSLKGQLTIPGLRLSSIRNGSLCNGHTNSSNRELSDVEKKQAEERLFRLKSDTDNKRLAIKNLKLALERLDITDNIDVRIQQAELEYQLGREELNLLTLLEETRALQICLDESNRNSSDSHTLYSCTNGKEHVSLHAIEVVFDPKSPKFGAGQREGVPGLWIDWALEDTGICKEDRLIEVNGKIVLNKSREDLARLLSAAPDPAQIVVLRKHSASSCQGPASSSANNAAREITALKGELQVVRDRAEEAQRVKDGLRSDNIRLTHRISYLEEQVSELLARKNADDIRIITQSPVITSTVKTSQNVTNINISSQPTQVLANGNASGNGNSQKDLQVFQKGPQVTALVSNIPGLEVNKDAHTNLPVRSKSSLSNVSNTHIPAPSPQPSDHSCHKSHRHKHRNSRNGFALSASTQYLDQTENRFRKHHHREKDYSSETNSAVEYINRQNKKSSADNTNNGYTVNDYHKMNCNGEREKEYSDSNIMDQSYKKATKIVQELTGKHSRDSNLYEKHRQKCMNATEKYNADILKHYNARKSTSVLDFRSSQVENNNKYCESRSVENLDAVEAMENSHHHTKRLFRKLQDARSVKSLDFDSDCTSTTTTTNGNYAKSVDYTSEPISNMNGNNKKLGQNGMHDPHKPRPMPPKKPIRLSLHRAQSLQSVETPPITPSTSPDKSESRKPMKRPHKGNIQSNVSELQRIVSRPELHHQQQQHQQHNGIMTKAEYQNALSAKERLSAIKWTGFSHNKHKQQENGLHNHQHQIPNGSWC